MSGEIIKLLVITLVLALQASAQEVRPHPSEPQSVQYVGRYGEVLELRAGAKLLPSMHGDIEVLNIVPYFRADSEKPVLYRPIDADFKPENFSKLALVQMVVMPRSSVAAKNLRELRASKIEDLKKEGVDFRINDSPQLRRMTGKWPEDTGFEVFVGSPYKLIQLYVLTDKFLCILTTGVDAPPSTRIDHVYTPLRYSVLDWLIPVSPSDTFRKVTSRDIIEQGLRAPSKSKGIVVAGLIIIGFSLVMAGLGRRLGLEWMRRIGASAALFGCTGCALGGLVALACWPFPWAYRYSGAAEIVTLLLLPLFIGIIRWRRRRRIPLKALVVVAAWGLACLYFSVILSLPPNDRMENAALIPFAAAMMSFIYWTIGGALFGFLDSNSMEGRPALSLIFLLLGPSAGAQGNGIPIGGNSPNHIDDSDAGAARMQLMVQGVTPEKMIEVAREEMKTKQVLYRYQRVEIKGIFSKEDTNDVYPNLFDKQVEPSHIGDGSGSVVIPKWVIAARNRAEDLKELKKDAHGEFTRSALAAAAQLRGVEINEIVAHSWGTEIVYNAIKEGEIRPPRRLIVVGMPDRDMEKWRALSAHTGTEVVVYANSRDYVARSTRIVGGLLESARRAVGRDVEVDFNADWDAACRTRNCNPNNRVPKPPEFNYKHKVATHNRLEYYAAMLKDGTIPEADRDAVQKGAQQEALVAAEGNRLYEAAFADALSLVRERTQQQKDAYTGSRKADDALPAGFAVAKPIRESATPFQVPDQSLPGEFSMRQIQYIAASACSVPAKAFDEVLARIDWSDARKVQNLAAYNGNLSACELRVFNRLVEFGLSWAPGMTISVEEINSAAVVPSLLTPSQGGVIPPNQDHNPVWGKTGMRRP